MAHRPGHNTALDELRRKMLFRGKGSTPLRGQRSSTIIGDNEISPHPPTTEVEIPKEQLADDAEAMRTALFQGRSLPISVVAPQAEPEIQTDPHKLFQMLRKKKRASASGNGTGNSNSAPSGEKNYVPYPAPHSPQPPGAASGHSPQRPHELVSPPRPQGGIPSRRPAIGRKVNSANPEERSARNREVMSAGANGRPCTRQKHPKKALDLFEERTEAPEEHFPTKRRASAPNGLNPSTLSKVISVANGGPGTVVTVPSPNKAVGAITPKNADDAGKATPGGTAPVQSPEKADVNFSCLFVTDEDELGGGDDDAFPVAPKAHVNIPLIETDWFTTDSWEPLPTSDGHEVMECDKEDYAESLYTLLSKTRSQRQLK